MKCPRDCSPATRIRTRFTVCESRVLDCALDGGTLIQARLAQAFQARCRKPGLFHAKLRGWLRGSGHTAAPLHARSRGRIYICIACAIFDKTHPNFIEPEPHWSFYIGWIFLPAILVDPEANHTLIGFMRDKSDGRVDEVDLQRHFSVATAVLWAFGFPNLQDSLVAFVQSVHGVRDAELLRDSCQPKKGSPESGSRNRSTFRDHLRRDPSPPSLPRHPHQRTSHSCCIQDTTGLWMRPSEQIAAT